ncbi:sensor histidine kinase [Streptomyces sp. BV129]|uniref:sensor histidine kinase n=1 Tax=Streptomyces sp. BV129 TaxID=2849671 RepID=UPI001C2EEC1A|nr:histidine kinase [Streptomyces sp. BV129]MBV1949379.1 ATP-binding protein [Streptomyces sp. BV129]MBV1949500.1 ATP-binding protein [Streptomyces sp. BV129]
MAAVNRDPLTAPHRTRNDVFLAVGVTVLAVVLALLVDDGLPPGAPGWALLAGAHVSLVWRRSRPLLVLLAVAACVTPYHALDYDHAVPIPATLLALYTVAATGTVRRSLLTAVVVLGPTLIINSFTNPDGALELLRISGWIIAVLFFGVDARFYRRYVASIVERAERAERTREEEVRRRVVEERLRIARDLHDLLAHSITLIGVRTSVAAHVLTADPDRLDHKAVAQVLDDIAETCRTARGELRTTLEVLRANETSVGAAGQRERQRVAGPGSGPGPGSGSSPGSGLGFADGRGPLPGLDGLGALVEAAREAGAEVELSVHADGVPPSVGAAAYRIVQEALTNAVRHGGREDLTVRVGLRAAEGTLRVTVTDDGTSQGTGRGTGQGTGQRTGRGTNQGMGRGPGHGVSGAVRVGVGRGQGAAGSGPGFGLVGMRERARSVGGTLDAGPGPTAGFEVTAVLPLPREEPS